VKLQPNEQRQQLEAKLVRADPSSFGELGRQVLPALTDVYRQELATARSASEQIARADEDARLARLEGERRRREAEERQAREAEEQKQRERQAELAARYKFSFKNGCNKEVFVAVMYQPVGSSEWKIQGWYKIAPGALRDLPHETKNANFYWYAEAGTLKWAGSGEFAINARVHDTEPFQYTHPASTGKVVSFHRWQPSSYGRHERELTCN
jgi:hypothetical protein